MATIVNTRWASRKAERWLHFWMSWDLRPCLGPVHYFWEAQLRATSMKEVLKETESHLKRKIWVG